MSQRGENYSLNIPEIKALIDTVKLTDALAQSITTRLPKNKNRIRVKIERELHCMRVFVALIWLSYLGDLLRGTGLYIDFQGLCFVSEAPPEKERTLRRFVKELVDNGLVERKKILFQRSPFPGKGMKISPGGLICAEAFVLFPFKAKKYTRSQYCFRIKTVKEYMPEFEKEAQTTSGKILNVLKEVGATEEFSEQFVRPFDSIKSFLPELLEDVLYTIPRNLIRLMKEYELIKKEEEEAFDKMFNVHAHRDKIDEYLRKVEAEMNKEPLPKLPDIKDYLKKQKEEK